MINQKKLNIGLTTSMITILIYIDHRQSSLLVILLSMMIPFVVALKK